MSTLRVYNIENPSTAAGGIGIATDGSVTVGGLQYPTAGPLSNRNLIINGGMRVAQRGTTSTSGGYQTVDRMDVQMAQGSFSQSQETLATSDLPFTENGHTYFVRMTNTTGSTAGAAFRGPSTILEAQDIHFSGWNYKSTSSYVTLSFWVRASVSQEFYASLVAFDGTQQNYVFSFTPEADTWTKVTKTIPGNTNLQFDLDNGPGLKISISAFWGTDWTDSSVTTDSWQAYTSSTRFPDFATTWANTNGATFDVTGVQLEVGERATPFEHRSYADELIKCMRYYERGADTSFTNVQDYWSGQTTGSTTVARRNLMFRQIKRTTPTTITVLNVDRNGFPSTTPTVTQSHAGGFGWYLTANATSNDGYLGVRWTANAEL